MKFKTITPVGARILVARHSPDEVSEGGIQLPGSTQQEQSSGVVAVISKESSFDGQAPGFNVLFPAYAGVSVEGPDGEDLLVLDDVDVIAVAE